MTKESDTAMIRKNLFLSILAGICIGLGGTVFLSIENKILGALLFSIGLFTILGFGFNLFTGKVGYLLENSTSYLTSLILTWAGNLVGTTLLAFLVGNTRIYSAIAPRVKEIVSAKLSDSYISIFLLAIGCGLCMFIAVDQYKKRSSTVRALFVIFPVMVFILCSFEHCVANMFYFALARSYNFKTLIYLLIMTAGNTVGGILIPVLTRLGGVNLQQGNE